MVSKWHAFLFFKKLLRGESNFVSAHLCMCYIWNPTSFWLYMACIIIYYFNSCLSPGRKLTWVLDTIAPYLDFPEVLKGSAWQLVNQTFWSLIAPGKNGFVEGTSFLTNPFRLTFFEVREYWKKNSRNFAFSVSCYLYKYFYCKIEYIIKW